MDSLDDNFLPKLPTFADELIEQCTKNKDFRPILFEWYKYVGILCVTVASISPESPALRNVTSTHYAILTGLLNRCSRLMLSNACLSSKRKHGETTRLLDRSITESAIKIQWLCHKNDDDGFLRYMADGLEKDLVLKKQIEENIENRNDEILVIEQRMLNSIEKCIELSGLSEQEIISAKKLPDLASMSTSLGKSDIFYTAIQRMGSHAVHGTWSDLVFNYLRHDDGQRLHLRDHEIETQDVQFTVVIELVLDAMKSFLNYVISNVSELTELFSVIDNIKEEIVKIQHSVWASDFNVSNSISAF